MKLSPAQKASFLRDGYIVLRGVVPPAVTGAAVRELNNRLGTGEHPDKDGYADKHDYLSEYVSSPAVMALAKGTLRTLVESLLGPGKVEPLSQGQVVLRFPSANDAVEYEPLIHIDGPYAGKDGKYALAKKPRFTLNAGVFLSDLPGPDMGNLVVYPGTHRAIAALVKKRGVEALKGAIEKNIDMPGPVQVTGKTGDIVLMHFQLAHDKARNDSPHIRRTVYFRFWHADSWHDGSRDYLTRAMTDPWLEWPGMKGVR